MFCFVAFYQFPPTHPHSTLKNPVFMYTQSDNCNTHNCVWPLIILIQIILCILRYVTFVFCTSLFTLVCLTCLILLNSMCSVTVGVLPYSTLHL